MIENGSKRVNSLIYNAPSDILPIFKNKSAIVKTEHTGYDQYYTKLLKPVLK